MMRKVEDVSDAASVSQGKGERAHIIGYDCNYS